MKRNMQRKILVVDDDKGMLEEVQETLKLNGFDVVTLDNPNEVEETVKQTRPIAILLDLKMPGKSGFQIATELKRLKENVGIPIIAMSGVFCDDSYAPLMRICGIQTCLKKPFTADQMVKTIRVMLNLSNQ